LQPTKELIDRTVENELLTRQNPPRHQVFHGGTVGDGNVVKEFMAYLKGFDEGGGEIIFAPQQVLPLIPYFHNKHLWHVLWMRLRRFSPMEICGFRKPIQ
jgi:hypothetical protein